MRRFTLSAMLLSGCAICFASPEIVTNRLGQKINLNPNKTWDYVSKNLEKSDVITSDGIVELQVLDGNGTPVAIKATIKIDADADTPLSKAYIVEKVNALGESVKSSTKNEFSYIPKQVEINQRKYLLHVNLKYTANNSYGAPVVGENSRGFRYEDDQIKGN